MLKKILYPFLSALLVFAVACRKDSTVTDIDMEPRPPIITAQATLLGLVTDLDGNTLEGAQLTLGNSQTTSDENGYFKITGFTDSKNAIVKVEMPGYFDVWHAFQYFEKDISQTRIRLTPRANPLTLSANTGGDIQFENTTISFQANSFVDESGDPYNGDVSIYTAYLDPTDPDRHTFMPGNLTAIDADNQLQLLVSYGMINVELEGDAGQKLQITQPATIEMTVPSSIVNHAPATIPLWYFDTDEQRWVEEGMANLQGDKYVGTVNHFSFWNCDDPYTLINLNGQAYYGESGAGLEVCITILSNGDQSCTTTSVNDGYFGGGIPAGEELLLEIFGDCGTAIYSETIGPFNDDVTVGPYVLNPTQAWARVEGKVVDCDGAPVSNGYVYGSWSSNQFGVFNLASDGSFSKYINTCNASSITLKAMDSENLKSGDPEVFNLSPLTDVGTLQACENELVEGVFIEYGGNTFNLLGSTISSSLNGSGNPVFVTEFNMVDDQGTADKVIYKFTIVDWGNGNIAYEVNSTLVGNPPNVFSFVGGSAVITLDGQQPGDFIILEAADITLSLNGTEYLNSRMTIVGIIQ
ncbi:MAG: carboxypeptidase-like regulatory domain-containing protein [Bacteroidota bacterium]